MTEKAASVVVEPFRPRSGVTIHTTDEEAKEAAMNAGSKSKLRITGISYTDNVLLRYPDELYNH